MEAVFAATSDAVFAKKPSGTILYANRAFVDNFTSHGDPEGRKAVDVLPEEIQQVSVLTDDMVLYSKHPAVFSYECSIRGVAGQKFNTMKFPLLDERGEVLAILGVCYQCSQEKGVAHRSEAIDVDLLLNAKRTIESLPDVYRRVMLLAARGYINKQVAKMLEVSVRSVENYRSKLIRLLGVKSSTEMAGVVTQLEQFGLLRIDEEPGADEAGADERALRADGPHRTDSESAARITRRDHSPAE